MKKLIALCALALFIPLEAQAGAYMTLHCESDDSDCSTATKRRAYVEATMRMHFRCFTGFESNCSAIPGSTYEIGVWVHGTPTLHNCENRHYIHQVGVVSITDPFTGASGVDFIVSSGTFHCPQQSCNSGCGCQFQ